MSKELYCDSYTEVELRHLFLTTGEVSLHCQLKPSRSSVRFRKSQNISKNKKNQKTKKPERNFFQSGF
jgi:hypothetical protein